MNTNDLIDSLAKDLDPIQPLPRPGKRAAVWLIGAIVYLAFVSFGFSSFGQAMDGVDRGFVQTQLIGVAAGILAAVAAFASVIPGYSKRVLIWPAIATIAWLAVFLYASLSNGPQPDVLAASHEWVCVAVILVGGAPLVAALTVMLRRGAPLNPMLTALLGALAVGLLANFGACVSRPHSENAVTLVWHGGALIALAFVCIAGSRFVLSWGSRQSAKRG